MNFRYQQFDVTIEVRQHDGWTNGTALLTLGQKRHGLGKQACKDILKQMRYGIHKLEASGNSIYQTRRLVLLYD